MRAGLSFALTGLGCILQTLNFRTRCAAERKCLRPFFGGFFEMIFDVITALFLVLGLILFRLIGRRRGDVLYYVSKPDTRW
jgi:hypothetical protein